MNVMPANYAQSRALRLIWIKSVTVAELRTHGHRLILVNALAHSHGQKDGLAPHRRGCNMNSGIDLVDMARALAEIARTTTDQKTGRLLLELIERLLREAGLPPDI